MSAKPVILAMRADECVSIEPGSVLIPCKKCGVLLTVSPSGQKFIQEQGALVGCAKCIHEEGDYEMSGPVSVKDIEKLIAEAPNPERLARKIERAMKSNDTIRKLAKGEPFED